LLKIEASPALLYIVATHIYISKGLTLKLMRERKSGKYLRHNEQLV